MSLIGLEGSLVQNCCGEVSTLLGDGRGVMSVTSLGMDNDEADFEAE